MRSGTTTAGRPSGPDQRFGGVSGAYLGLLAAPAAVLLGDGLGVSEAWILYLSFLGTLALVGTTAGWWLHRRPSLAVRLGATRRRWVPMAIAVGYAAAGFTALGDAGVGGLLAFFCGLLAFLAGVAVAVIAQTRYTVAVTAGTEELTRWRASWPESAQRRRLHVGGAIAGIATVGFVVGAVFSLSLLQYTGQILFPSGFVLISTGGTRTAIATEAGLEIRLPMAKRFYAWDELSSYELDSESLVITRRWGADLRFATTEIDDVSLVEWTLAERIGEE